MTTSRRRRSFSVETTRDLFFWWWWWWCRRRRRREKKKKKTRERPFVPFISSFQFEREMDDIGRNTKNNITNRAPPRFVRVREFLRARGEETKWLVESLKRKTGEEKFGSDALDARARRRATSPRNWTCWQREKRKRKRPAASSLDDFDETNEGREETTCRKKRRKETRKTRWVRESGRLATHEWLAKRYGRCRIHFFTFSLERAREQNMPMKKKYAPSQSEMNTMATRDLVT